MPKTRRFLAMTFGELATWHACGETRVLRSRFVDIRTQERNGAASVMDDDAVQMLLRRLPPLALDDEEGVLIARLQPAALADDEEDSQLVRLSIDMLGDLIPLTTRAKAILDDRLVAYGIVLQEPWFHGAYRHLSYKRRVEASVRAADALVSIFVPGCAWKATDALIGEALHALALKDFDDTSLAGVQPGAAAATWIPVAFGWTRRASYGKDALSDLADAGQVLKQLQSQSGDSKFADAVLQLRDCVKSIRDKYGEGARIREVLGSEEFAAAARSLYGAVPYLFPVELGALVLYLRWQEKFHSAGSSLDVQGLSGDLRGLFSVATVHVVGAALWLLGFYAGCERVMPLRYATESSAPSWFHGRKIHVELFEGRTSETPHEPPSVVVAAPAVNLSDPVDSASNVDVAAHGDHISGAAAESVIETEAQSVQPVQSGMQDSATKNGGAAERGAEPSEPNNAPSTVAALQAAAAKPKSKSKSVCEEESTGSLFGSGTRAAESNGDGRSDESPAPDGNGGGQHQSESPSKGAAQSQVDSSSKDAESDGNGGGRGKRGSSTAPKKSRSPKKPKPASGK